MAKTRPRLLSLSCDSDGELTRMSNMNLLFLFFGLAIIGDNSLCSRWQNKVFNFLGAAMIVYGAANSLATAYVRLST